MNNIPKYYGPMVILDTPQMIEVDRLMIENYKIELIQMMENAGRCLAIVARNSFWDKNPINKKVVVLAGTGGNGGGAMVCARRLHNWGAKVSVFITANEEKMTPIPLHQLNILKQMGINIHIGDSLNNDIKPDLIIDGIIGYSISGDPYGTPKKMIEWANTQEFFTLSLDTPSGLNLTTGTIYNPIINADATLTLALPKKGLYKETVKPLRGDLYLGDISVPPSLYAKETLGLNVSPIFASSDVLLID